MTTSCSLDQQINVCCIVDGVDVALRGIWDRFLWRRKCRSRDNDWHDHMVVNSSAVQSIQMSTIFRRISDNIRYQHFC